MPSNTIASRFREITLSRKPEFVAGGGRPSLFFPHLYYVLPNLAPFNVKAEVVYGMPVSASHLGFTLLYAAVYIAALLVAAVAIFRRRDFK